MEVELKGMKEQAEKLKQQLADMYKTPYSEEPLQFMQMRHSPGTMMHPQYSLRNR